MASCKDCKDRHVGCHSNCEIYKEYTRELEEKKHMIKEAKNKDREYKNYKKKRIEKELRGRWQ